jgi:phage terminase large subunit-like protein
MVLDLVDDEVQAWLLSQPDDVKAELYKYIVELDMRRKRNKLAEYQPYPKQLEFHASLKDYDESMLLGSNQSGKTWAGAYEMAMHLTGRYPEDWPGHRFEHPIVAIAGSVTGELTRKGIQRMLIGKPEVRKEWGTGTIPFDCFGDITMKTGVKHAVDSILVKHVSGEYSVLKLLSYEQGQEKWQADTVHYVWFDEEPPWDVYMEGITRTNATRGKIAITFTPLHGMSQVVSRFYPKPTASTCKYVQMGVKDALHYTDEDIAKMLEKYPPHEQQARMYGIPQFGEGLVINLDEKSYTIDPFEIPKHWRRGAGIDFGVSHPTACIQIVHDADTDTYYVISEYVEKDKTPMMIAEAVKGWGALRWFWPHDGLQRDKGSLLPLADQYRDRGMDMWHEQASHAEGGNSLEAGVMQILEMLATGKLKIFKSCQKLLQEMRQYHRLKGLIVKENDDAISAMRYGVMMSRFFAAPMEKMPDWQKTIRSKRKSGTSGW